MFRWGRARPPSGRLRWFPARTVPLLYRRLSSSSSCKPATLPGDTRSAHFLDQARRLSARARRRRQADSQTWYLLGASRSEEHTSELQSPDHLVCRLLLEKKKTTSASE